MKGMVSLVMEKMITDLPDLMYDEHQFSHLVDEAILFDREIRSSYGYSSAYPGSLHILTEGEAFQKWLLIEKKCESSSRKHAYIILTPFNPTFI